MSTTKVIESQPNIWGKTGDPNPDAVAQEAHFGWGMGMTFVLALLFLAFGLNPLFALPANALIWSVKESLESLGWAPWEGKQPWFSPWNESSARDLLYFELGSLTAVGVIGFTVAKVLHLA